MTKKRSWTARLLALAALVAAVVAVIVITSNADLGSSSDHQGGPRHARAHREKQPRKTRPKAKTYVVQSGDTLTSIAHEAGVSLAELQALNPEVDPQTLIAGEVLKLRR